MKHLFSRFLVAFFITSAVVLSWSEYFFLLKKEHEKFINLSKKKKKNGVLHSSKLELVIVTILGSKYVSIIISYAYE